MIGPGIKEICAIKVVWSTVEHPVVRCAAYPVTHGHSPTPITITPLTFRRNTLVGKYTLHLLANFTFSDAALGSLALLHSRENSNISGIYPGSPKYNNR